MSMGMDALLPLFCDGWCYVHTPAGCRSVLNWAFFGAVLLVIFGFSHTVFLAPCLSLLHSL